MCFSVQFLYSSALTFVWYFLVFPFYLSKFSLCSPILDLSSVKIFMTITLNYLSGMLLIFILLGLFLRLLSYSFVWNIYLFPHLAFSICFSVLGERVSLPVLKEWPSFGTYSSFYLFCLPFCVCLYGICGTAAFP